MRFSEKFKRELEHQKACLQKILSKLRRVPESNRGLPRHIPRKRVKNRCSSQAEFLYTEFT